MATETKNTKAFYNTEIPRDWEFKELSSVGKISSGGTPDTTNEIYWNGNINWCTPTDITKLNGSKYIGETIVKISDKGLKSSSATLLPIGSVIVCTRATIGKAAISVEEISTNQGFKNIIPNLKKVDVEFLYYSIINSGHKLLRLGNGSTFLEVPKSDFEKFKIPLPPLPEQKAIAQVLSTADAAIHTTEKLIAQKELRKKWLMQQLLTGKKRLKGFGGEWKKLGAGEIFKSVTKKGFADEELLSATQDKGMIPRTMLEGRVTMPTSGTEGFKLVEIGDFIISLRSFQGGLEYSYYRGLVSPAYTVLKPKKKISEEFYKQYFKSYDFIGHLAIAVIGIRDGKQISYDDFCTVKIPYPSIEEQTAIAQVLQAADKEISLLKAKAEKLREQKKGLMQVLLKGKKRLL